MITRDAIDAIDSDHSGTGPIILPPYPRPESPLSQREQALRIKEEIAIREEVARGMFLYE